MQKNDEKANIEAWFRVVEVCMIHAMKTYTIGQLAKVTDVPTSTVRYYERRGLLMPAARSGGNYRLFDEEALDRLRFIRSAQGAGFTLGDIEELLELRTDRASPCDEVQALISARLEEVGEQIEHLRVMESMLGRWFKSCQCEQNSGRCSVIAGLGESENGVSEKNISNARKRP
jgi:MerR family transcriptional regulator, mercuric resistance operon regulatory protein